MIALFIITCWALLIWYALTITKSPIGRALEEINNHNLLNGNQFAAYTFGRVIIITAVINLVLDLYKRI